MVTRMRLRRLWLLFLALWLIPVPGSGERRPLSRYLVDKSGRGIRFDPAEEGGLYRGFVDSEKGEALVETEGWWKQAVTFIVEARVSFDSTKKEYCYHYKLDNEKSSWGVRNFEVVYDSALPVYQFTAPAEKASHWFFQVAGSGQDTTRKQEYPGGDWRWAELPPYKWFGGLGYGESVGGFSFKSSVLPGITKCWSFIVIPDDDVVLLRGKTIGPVAAPQEFESLKFVERLNSIVDESLTEGWIEDEGVAKRFKKRLESAREAVERRDQNRLESVLKDLLKQVEREKDRSLLSEAYGLLKFNIQYWLEQLGEGRK